MTKVNIDLIHPDPAQPRQEFDPEAMMLLRKSIASHGILQPLVVEKNGAGYLIVDGERRYRASKLNGLKEVPVEIMDKMSVSTRFIKRFHLQEQHRSWSYFDKARAIKAMLNSKEITLSGIANVLGVPANRINDMLSLLSMSKRSQKLIQDKKIPYTYLIEVNKISNQGKDKSQKEALEHSLVDRIEQGQITNPKKLRDFGVAVKFGGQKVIQKIIKDSGYTSEKAGKEAKTDGMLSWKNLKGGLNWAYDRANACLEKNGAKYVDNKSDYNMLKSLATKLNKIADDVVL